MPPGAGRGRLQAASLVREVVSRAGVRPSRDLGQHFIVADWAVSEFMKPLERAAKRLNPGGALEIGPGAGSLTLPASDRLSRIVAVELDSRLARALREIAPPAVSVVVGDGVSHARAARAEVVFSNTPFHLAPAIVEALARNSVVSAAVLGVQLEVARRMAARPGTRDYGRLSILVGLVFRPEIAAAIPPKAYWPPPEVLTAVVVLERRRVWEPWMDGVMRLSTCIFSQRRKRAYKVLAECLESMGCRAPAWLHSLGDTRVWELGLEVLERAVEGCGSSRSILGRAG